MTTHHRKISNTVVHDTNEVLGTHCVNNDNLAVNLTF